MALGGSEVHQALRNLCLNTDWNYAIFWKLKHQARMVLTWEDAYYDKKEKNDPSGSNWFEKMVDNLQYEQYTQDHLGLAVAKMSYHVHSLGEGIVGQAAVTGKHLWISGDQLINNSCSLVEHCDGWEAQFSAGIRTIAVVAVIPHGVIQLGSFNCISEDLKLVNHIRESFFELQSPLMGMIPIGQTCSIDCSPCPSDLSTRSSSGKIHKQINNHNRTMEKHKSNICTPKLPLFEKPESSYLLELHGSYPKIPIEMINNYQEPECPLLPISEISQIQEFSSLMEEDMGRGSKLKSQHDLRRRTNSCNDTVTADNFGVEMSYSISDLLEPTHCNDQNGKFSLPETSNVQMLKNSDENMESQSEIDNLDTLETSFKFPAGCELYEALGPAFCKPKNNSDWETETVNSQKVNENSNLLTPNPSSEHLLEAVIANVCYSDSDEKGSKSFSKSVKSLMPMGKMIKTSDSACNSFEQSLVNSEAYGSLQGFSSASHSRCSEQQLDRSQEPTKVSKKRARPGESCRPRPRDRQLIQDRIKELRELVPNGSKCSIDSLLEKTIKHMLFMQCVTKHAEKIDKCAESKLLGKETGIRGPSRHEHGSSWAMEVGNHLELCPILVENIGVNGQMLVEMLCDECVDFLEIAEAIRSLGLAILKGVTEAHGDKTWMCFVVEGHNNRSMHRMDILWSLVQVLQSKTKTTT